MSDLKERLNKWLKAYNNADDANIKAPSYLVAAGDPAQNVVADGKLVPLDEEELEGNRKQFLVCGISMTPKDIDDGDRLICCPVLKNEDKQFKEGWFLVIKVDPKYYPDEYPIFEYKLRCSIAPIRKGMQVDEIINLLKSMDSQPEIWLEEYQKILREKLEKARRVYPDDSLILSCTYKNGDLRYSFHQVDAVEYIAETRIPRDLPTERIPLK